MIFRLSTRLKRLAAGTLAFYAGNLPAIEVSWQPETPSAENTLRIEIRGAEPGAHLRWGVNATKTRWVTPQSEYIPPGSSRAQNSAHTPFHGPGPNGEYFVELGPFLGEQKVHSVDFAIQLNEHQWENNRGRDYHIPVGQPRIRIEPANPTMDDPITVVIQKSREGGLLHWGVNAINDWRQPHPCYWTSNTVPFHDGLSVETPLPPPDWDGSSTITLGPFNQPNQMVTSLHFVVRWGGEWDINLGRNYNFNLVSPGSQITINAPVPDGEYTDELEVRLAGPAQGAVTVFLDGDPVGSIPDGSDTTTISLSNVSTRQHMLTVASQTKTGPLYAQIPFWRVPAFTRSPVPEESYQLGAHAVQTGRVLFALHAPGKRFVTISGSFNNWSTNDTPMHLAADGTWWALVELPPELHEYQYILEGGKRIADPYARQVRWEDPAGRPSGNSADARAILDLRKRPPFNWSTPDYVRPSLNRLSIYELFIPDLCPGKGFRGVINHLDEIKAMGFNAIEPLPVTEAPVGEGTWGYDVAFHFAPESSYGTPADLKALIHACHERGIAFIFDLVLNHMSGSGPLWQLYGEDYEASPYFYLFEGENWGFPDIDQESRTAKAYARDVIEYWIREFRVDGFRYDATRWVGWSGYNDWGASWFAYAARQADSNSIQIAEHLPTDAHLMNDTEMDSGWEAHVRWRLREQITRAEVEKHAFNEIINPAAAGFSNHHQRVIYVESHDEERFIRELLHAGFNMEEAMERALMAAAITQTAPGIPMVYAGQELAEFTPKRVGLNPLRLDVTELPLYRDFKSRFTRLTRLRTTHPALLADAAFTVRQSEDGIIEYVRTSGNSMVWLLANVGREPAIVPANPPGSAFWQDVLDDFRPVEFNANEAENIELAPGQTRVFATR